MKNLYFIIPSVDVTQEMITMSATDIPRLSVDKSLTLLKGDDSGNIPPALKDYTYYTHEEIILILATSVWCAPLLG